MRYSDSKTKGRQPPLSFPGAAPLAHGDEEDAVSFGSWLLPLRQRAGVRVLLVAKEGSFQKLLVEALEQRGYAMAEAAGGREAVDLLRTGRFDVALVLLPPAGVPALLQDLSSLDADLEVVWMPPPISLMQAEGLVRDAAARARQRLHSLFAAARHLLQPLPPGETADHLLEQSEKMLGGLAQLAPHQGGEPQEVLLSPDRRRLRAPLWDGGPAPDAGPEEPEGGDAGAGGDSGHRLELGRAPDEPELSSADLMRAGILAALGSLALTRSHCEQAISDLYKELARAQKERAADREAPPGRGLTSGAVGPLERLAGVLAHELNNPLTFVLANLACLQEELAALREALHNDADVAAALARCDEIDEVLSEAMGGAGRVREVVSDLTTLGARSDLEGDQQPVVIEDVIRAALRIAKREVQRRARVTVELEPQLPPVLGSASRLGQVVLNLLLNAVQAVPAPGDMANHAANHEVRVRARRKGEYLALTITDTGTGIPVETLSRVFEPGYTTKPLGEGSGLGLAISREIVRAHGGDIQIDSQPGKGTAVTVFLPAHKAAARGASLSRKG